MFDWVDCNRVIWVSCTISIDSPTSLSSHSTFPPPHPSPLSPSSSTPLAPPPPFSSPSPPHPSPPWPSAPLSPTVPPYPPTRRSSHSSRPTPPSPTRRLSWGNWVRRLVWGSSWLALTFPPPTALHFPLPSHTWPSFVILSPPRSYW